MGFPRSEESFVAVLGLCYTPGYLCDESESVSRDCPSSRVDLEALAFRCAHFGPGLSIRVSLSCSDDASNAHFSFVAMTAS